MKKKQRINWCYKASYLLLLFICSCSFEFNDYTDTIPVNYYSEYEKNKQLLYDVQSYDFPSVLTKHFPNLAMKQRQSIKIQFVSTKNIYIRLGYKNFSINTETQKKISKKFTEYMTNKLNLHYNNRDKIKTAQIVAKKWLKDFDAQQFDKCAKAITIALSKLNRPIASEDGKKSLKALYKGLGSYKNRKYLNCTFSTQKPNKIFIELFYFSEYEKGIHERLTLVYHPNKSKNYWSVIGYHHMKKNK
jgi:hypothetical protein